MNKILYFKVLVLVAALGGVVYVMTHLSAAKVSQGMVQVGLNAPSSGQPPAGASGGQGMPDTQNMVNGIASPKGPDSVVVNGSVNLCPTRVHAIIWTDGRKIEEAKSGMKAKWQAYNLDPTDIGAMEVEKWLSLHCEIQVRFRDATASVKLPAPPFAPVLSFVYIDGVQIDLNQAPDGAYRFKDQVFDSPDLTKAIADLVKLANLQPQGP